MNKLTIQGKEINIDNFDQDYINFLKGCCKRGNGRQNILDTLLLMETCVKTAPRNIVEIGSYDGVSTQVLGTYAKENKGHLWCVEPVIRDLLLENIKELELEDDVTLVQGKSPWVDPQQRNIEVPIDLLLIDADHTTRSCLVDYTFWYRYVQKGGIIIIHDWCGNGANGKGVRRAIDIIMETDENLLEEFARTELDLQGSIAYIKKGRFN